MIYHRYLEINWLGKIEELNYKYDPLNRLTEVLDGDELLRKYSYDSLGNRIAKYENGKTNSCNLYNIGV